LFVNLGQARMDAGLKKGSTTALSIMDLIVTLSINYSPHKDT
jgi:hypothetical protein